MISPFRTPCTDQRSTKIHEEIKVNNRWTRDNKNLQCSTKETKEEMTRSNKKTRHCNINRFTFEKGSSSKTGWSTSWMDRSFNMSSKCCDNAMVEHLSVEKLQNQHCGTIGVCITRFFLKNLWRYMASVPTQKCPISLKWYPLTNSSPYSNASLNFSRSRHKFPLVDISKSMLVIIDCFPKMTCFVSCNKTSVKCVC